MSFLIQHYVRFKDVALKCLPCTKGHLLWSVFFATLVVVGLIIFTLPTYGLDFDTIVNGIIYGLAWIMFGIASLFIKLTIFFLQMFILIAGYNNYINADVVKLGWNMVRDVTNMFFVVALLVIAFGTVLGLESYEWRKLLPKLLLAALLVNFSNLICQLIIDVAQVFTITFLNAVAGAAGGNLIQMFNFEDIYRISTADPGTAGEGVSKAGIRLDFFIASVISLTFTAMAMITMFAYLVVILARMVVLWALIILSPLAFVLGVMPSTKSYADEFWKEFTNHVLVAPIMVFFLWLAFATFGGGNVVGEHIEKGHPIAGAQVTNRTDTDGRQVSAGLSRAATYDRMANFAVALAFLMMGIERVQKLGVQGGGLVQSAKTFGKNVATIASGVALAKWVGGQAKAGVLDTAKDYGKLVKGQTVDRLRHAQGIRNIPILGAAGKVRRKAAVEKMEQLYKAKEEQYKAEGGGIAGKFAPSHLRMAEQVFATENATRETKAKKERIEGQFRIDVIKKDKALYTKDVEGALSAAREQKVDGLLAARKKEKGRDLTPEEVDAIQNEEGDLTRAEEGNIRNRVAQKYGQVRIANLEGTASAKQSKAKKETEILQAEGKDTDRLRENKIAKYIRNMQDADFNDDIKDYSKLSFDDRLRELGRERRQTKVLRAEYKQLTPDQKNTAEGKNLKQQLKNSYVKEMHILTSAHEQDEGNDIMQYGVYDELSDKDKAKWEQMGGWNTGENYGRLMQTQISGRELDDFLTDGQWDVGKAAQIENEVRGVVTDKWNLTMRGLMRAMNAAASKTNNPHYAHQLRVGFSAGNQEELGFSENLIEGKVGSEDTIVGPDGKPKKVTRYSSGSEERDGAGIRNVKQNFLEGEIQRLSEIKDGRTIFTADRNGNAMNFSDKTAQMMRSIAGMSVSEIRSLHKSILNMASGGKYEESSFHADSGNFAIQNAEMKPMFTELIEEMRNGITDETVSETTRDRRVEALQELMRKLTGGIAHVNRETGQIDIVLKNADGTTTTKENIQIE